MKDIQNEMGFIVNEAIIRAYKNASSQLKYLIQSKPDECFLSLPALCITYLDCYLKDNNYNLFSYKLMKYRGMNVIPGYENSVVIFHQDSVLHGSDALIIKELLILRVR